MRRAARRWSLPLGCGAWLLGACLPGTPVADNLAPVAVAGDDVTVALGEAVWLDGSRSHDDDGEVVGYEWNLGDGSAAQGVTAQHTFAEARAYVVALTVTDDAGATGHDELIVTVGGDDPVAVMEIAPAEARRFEQISFDGSASHARAAIVSYSWSFGDGASATGAIASHAYANVGTFRVQLTVEDEAGNTGDAEQLLNVLPVDVDGTYDLSATPGTYSCSSYDLSFTEGAFTFAADGAGGLSATSAAGHAYTGSVDDMVFSVSAGYSSSTGGMCGSAPVSATLSGSFGAGGTLTGTWVGYYDLSVPCQCTAAFEVTGALR